MQPPSQQRPLRSFVRRPVGVRRSLWLLLLLGLISPTVARAGVALVLEPWSAAASDPSLGSGERATLQQAVQLALSAEQFTLTDGGDRDAAIAGEPQLKDCFSDDCQERLGRLLAANIVVRYRVKVDGVPTASRRPDWKLSVELLDVEVGAGAARLTESCSGCTLVQSAELLAELVKRAVLESASRPRGILEIRSEPTGSTVFVDGSELGVTPYKRPTFAGRHQVALRHTGFRTQQLPAPIEEGQKLRLDPVLVAGSDPLPGAGVERSPVYRKWWFWVALGGAVAVAGGVTAAIVAGTHSPPPPDRLPGPYTLQF